MNLDKIQKRITKNIQRYEMLDAKGIAPELIDVLGEHNLAVADAIDILELAKHKILVTTKIKPSGQNMSVAELQKELIKKFNQKV